MGAPESGPSDKGKMAGKAGAVGEKLSRGIEMRSVIASGQEPSRTERIRRGGSPFTAAA